MSGKDIDATKIINGVVNAPIDVVGGTVRGFAGGATSLTKPMAEYIDNPDNNVALRIAAVPVATATAIVGGTVGAVGGTVEGIGKGITRVWNSIF